MICKFDADLHEYTIDGRKVPSVTQVINAVIPRSFHPGEWYMQRGRALHHAIHLQSESRLDWSSVDDRIKARLNALQSFLREAGVSIKRSEIQLASQKLLYAGTIDAQAIADDGLFLADWKSSVSPEVELQLGGYSLLWGESLGPKPHKALALELREDGSYSCKWLSKPALRRSENLFKAALSIYGFMQHNKIKGANEQWQQN